MYKLVLSNRFKKNLKEFLRQHPDLRKNIRDRLITLLKNPHAQQLKTHKLTGKLKDHSALSISYEYRLVFFIGKNEIYLLAIGTHDEVY